MGWAIEQNSGVNDYPTRFVFFKGYIYAFTVWSGVWRRDGIGPWVQVFAGTGLGWYWEADGALYCPGGAGGHQVFRSTDGLIWNMDIDLLVTFGPHAGGWWQTWGAMGGYGNYFYYANHDAGGPGTTYFYRRALSGVWDTPFATHAGAEGQVGRGIIGFGGEVYWLNGPSRVRYWDGAAWALEPTLDGNGGGRFSLIDGLMYLGSDPAYFADGGGFFWKTPSATNWAFIHLNLADWTWASGPLCKGGDGELYTLAHNGMNVLIYRKDGNVMHLVSSQTSGGFGLSGRPAICTEANGTIYWGCKEGATFQFFAYVPDFALTPAGGGLTPQAMDCDADGDSLYIAVYDGAGQPVLIRVPLPLTADTLGSTVFDPGAGNSINIKCAAVGGRLAISGLLSAGGNDSVQVSEDSGITFTDIAPAWADTAQPLLVDPDGVDEVAVALDAAQDLYDTEDQGVTWVQRQAAVGYSPGAMARLSDGDELVIGDDAANRIDYSPNRGQNLTDITAPFAGNVAALEVV